MAQRVVVSYIPAIHEGYLKFLRANPGKVFVLSKDYVLEFPRMDRDIRALDPTAAASMLSALDFEASVLTQSALSELKDAQIVMPDDEVNRAFAKKHLSGCPVQFVPAFLRWDMPTSLSHSEIPADRTITNDELDRELIGKARQESAKSPDWWRQIGAVVARDGKVLLTGHNHPVLAGDYSIDTFGDPRSNFDAGQHIELVKTIHAEAGLIAAAAKQGIPLDGASIYVTTFPCPGCAKSIAAAGIKKVYYQDGYSLLDAEDVLRAVGAELILVQ